MRAPVSGDHPGERSRNKTIVRVLIENTGNSQIGLFEETIIKQLFIKM